MQVLLLLLLLLLHFYASVWLGIAHSNRLCVVPCGECECETSQARENDGVSEREKEDRWKFYVQNHMILPLFARTPINESHEIGRRPIRVDTRRRPTINFIELTQCHFELEIHTQPHTNERSHSRTNYAQPFAFSLFVLFLCIFGMLID